MRELCHHNLVHIIQHKCVLYVIPWLRATPRTRTLLMWWHVTQRVREWSDHHLIVVLSADSCKQCTPLITNLAVKSQLYKYRSASIFTWILKVLLYIWTNLSLDGFPNVDFVNSLKWINTGHQYKFWLNWNIIAIIGNLKGSEWKGENTFRRNRCNAKSWKYAIMVSFAGCFLEKSSFTGYFITAFIYSSKSLLQLITNVTYIFEFNL